MTIIVETECRTIGVQGAFTRKLRQGTGATEAEAIRDAAEGWHASGYTTRDGRVYVPPPKRVTP